MFETIQPNALNYLYILVILQQSRLTLFRSLPHYYKYLTLSQIPIQPVSYTRIKLIRNLKIPVTIITLPVTNIIQYKDRNVRLYNKNAFSKLRE